MLCAHTHIAKPKIRVLQGSFSLPHKPYHFLIMPDVHFAKHWYKEFSCNSLHIDVNRANP